MSSLANAALSWWKSLFQRSERCGDLAFNPAVLFLCVIVYAAPGFSAEPQRQLAPGVQSDLLMSHALEALRKKDFESVLRHLSEFDARSIPMPPPLRLTEAKVAFATRDYEKAFESLQLALRELDKSSKQYSEAIGLYSLYEEAAHAAVVKLEKQLQSMCVQEQSRCWKEIDSARSIDMRSQLEWWGFSVEQATYKSAQYTCQYLGTDWRLPTEEEIKERSDRAFEEPGKQYWLDEHLLLDASGYHVIALENQRAYFGCVRKRPDA